MNNNSLIILAVKWKWLLMYIRPFSHTTCSHPIEYSYVHRYPLVFIWDRHVGLPTLPGAPHVLSGTATYAQTYVMHSYGTSEPVIQDPRYLDGGQAECPPTFRFSPEIDPSKFTLHILLDTPWRFPLLKQNLLL